MTLTLEQRSAWERDGFFIVRGMVAPLVGKAMEDELVDIIRLDPPSAHPGVPAYPSEGNLFIMPEAKPGDGVQPEDLISKVFNPHLAGKSRHFAHLPEIAAIVKALLDAPISVFQSQFILKNPGAWGQPWHQDSYYFPFNRQPQIGVWLAISEATLENGCLSVLPGSHKDPIHEHGPDYRPGSNHGYLEVRGPDFSGAIPVLMQPGDVLFFHSYLLHRSEDNRSRTRRSAMVYHYGRTGTEPVRELLPAQKLVLRWEEVAVPA